MEVKGSDFRDYVVLNEIYTTFPLNMQQRNVVKKERSKIMRK